MSRIPQAAEPLIQGSAGPFARLTGPRFVLLLRGTILTMGRRHKMPSELMQPWVAVLIRRFSQREFVFTDDGPG